MRLEIPKDSRTLSSEGKKKDLRNARYVLTGAPAEWARYL